MATVQEKITQIEDELIQLRASMNEQAKNLEEQKIAFTDGVNLEFTKHKLAMQEIVDSARKEFEKIQGDVQSLYQETKGAMEVVENRLTTLEKASKGANAGGSMKGYIPIKNMVPKVYGEKPDEWRQWQDDVMDYLDSINPGMREMLKDIEIASQPVDRDWAKMKTDTYGDKVTGDSVAVWRALKALTESEARKVVTNVRSEDGFRAWQKLHMRFGPSLAAKQGLVLAELSGMITKPAKNPSETRNLVTELERKVKTVEDITGEEVSDGHIKSVLVGILDPMTKQHTAMHHGCKHTAEDLKRVVLEFVNNVAGVAGMGGDAMQVGSFITGYDNGGAEITCQECSPEPGTAGSQDWGNIEGYMGAVSSGQQCYNCRGYGHIARECPSKGKGKGKGGWEKGDAGKSKGKGKEGTGYKGDWGVKGGGKKGPVNGGCWICGEWHYMANCPSKGKGKGVKGTNSLAETWPDVAGWGTTGDIRTLASISIVSPSGKEYVHRPEDGWYVMGRRGKVTKVEDLLRTKQSQGARKQEKRKRIANRKRQECIKMMKDLGRERCARQSFGRLMKEESEEAKSGGKAQEDLKMIMTIEPEGVNRVDTQGEWEVIDMAVDSGASETVLNEDMLPSTGTSESEHSRRGVQYEVANGVRIPNLGEKVFKGETEEGMTRAVRAQVCDVNKALLSVRKVVMAGNRVVFDQDGSYIEDKSTGEKMWLKDEGNMYMLRMWVRKPGF